MPVDTTPRPGPIDAAPGAVEPLAGPVVAAGFPPARPSDPMRNAWYLPLKAAFDFTAAVVLVVVAAPVVAVAALLVKLTSRGPAFYTQTRVGQYGQHFTIIKLRSMADKCESLTGPRWSTPGDPRVTRVGQFLRATHLDELPQLINVLRGEMSLVGPRPERPEFVPKLERSLPGYRERLRVKPGVSGLAQVQLPPDTDLASVERKLAHDLYYVQHLGPWLDLRIVCCTALYALGVPLPLRCRLCGVPGGEAVQAPRPAEPAAELVRQRAA